MGKKKKEERQFASDAEEVRYLRLCVSGYRGRIAQLVSDVNRYKRLDREGDEMMEALRSENERQSLEISQLIKKIRDLSGENEELRNRLTHAERPWYARIFSR